MSTSALESEDLENVPLVRMEDVQPSRSYEVSRRRSDEILGTCVIEDIEYDNECIVNDDDSNIGSMVSIQSEEVEECEPEMIVPDPLEYKPVDLPIEIKEERKYPSSWPTLEILPGGVIKKPQKSKDKVTRTEKKDLDMMYACAKCPQRFKYLFCLVKHVKWHEDEAKKQNSLNKPKKEPFICTHSNKQKMIMCLKALSKKKSPKKLKL